MTLEEQFLDDGFGVGVIVKLLERPFSTEYHGKYARITKYITHEDNIYVEFEIRLEGRMFGQASRYHTNGPWGFELVDGAANNTILIDDEECQVILKETKTLKDMEEG